MTCSGPTLVDAVLRLCLLLAALGIASVSQGQEPRLEEIVVVAQKREAPLRGVPLSVSVLSGADIETSGVTDVFDVATLIPSLDVRQNTGPLNTSFRIRRIGNEPNIVNFEPAVGLFMDGAFRTRTGTGSGDLFDIEQIEVLRGPQTTLYGKNTTAGVVSILTRQPTTALDIYAEVTGGIIEGAEDAAMTRIEGAIGGPLSNTFRARLSGAWFDHDETMVNLFNGRDSQDMRRYGYRAQLVYAPSTRFESRFIVGGQRIDSARAGDIIMDEGLAIAGINAAFGVPCPEHPIDERLFCANKPSVYDLDSDDLTLTIRYEGDSYRITSVSSFEQFKMRRDFDVDQLNIDLADATDRQHSRSLSQELRINSTADSLLSWMAGVFIYTNDFERGDPQLPTFVLGPAAALIEFAPGMPLGQPGDSGFVWSQSETDHVSAFANVTWPIGEKFELTTGARWQREDKQTNIDNSADHTRPTIITLRLVPEAANANLSRDTNALSWELIGKYRWNDDVMSYLTIARGFKSGGFNGGFGTTLPEDREFGDERVTSVEFGTKAMLLDGRARLSASVFDARYDDFQSAGWISLRYLVNNAEEVTVSGFEVDAQAALTDTLSGSLAASWANAEYDLYTGGACHFGRDPDNADGTACVLTGRTLPFAPRLRTATTVDYERPVHPGTLFGRLEWAWVDDHNTSASLDPRHTQGSYSVVNLRAGLRFEPFELVAWIRNAGDETIVMQEGPSNLFADDPAFGRFLAAPRSYGITLRARW